MDSMHSASRDSQIADASGDVKESDRSQGAFNARIQTIADDDFINKHFNSITITQSEPVDCLPNLLPVTPSATPDIYSEEDVQKRRKNANILSAVLCLVKELDVTSLRAVREAIDHQIGLLSNNEPQK